MKQAIIHIKDDTRGRPLTRIWRFVGYDEPNYTYSEGGRELLGKIGALEDSPYFIRCHFLLCTGDGTASLKWGSTNVYDEDADGNAVFSWEILDRIFDTIIDAGCLPFVEIGFMPKALSSAPQTIQYEGPGLSNAWSYPPAEYGKWEELIANLARHTLDRYGGACVRGWYWELWNEPDIGYWSGSLAEYCELFDVTERALHGVLPWAYLGGPGTTNPGKQKAGDFLRGFLEHCSSTGTRLDFISFHAKGGGYRKDPSDEKHTPTIDGLLSHVQTGIDIIDNVGGYQDREVILSECDPDGWAAGTIADNPNLFYRNTEYYASYVASAVCRLLDEKDGATRSMESIGGMLTWAFYFADRNPFEGFRALSTNGIEKPVFNVFRLLSKLGPNRLDVEIHVPDGLQSQVHTVAASDRSGRLTVFVCVHHDDWDVRESVEIVIELPKATVAKARMFRMDHERANTYNAWRSMRSPIDIGPREGEMLSVAGEIKPETVSIGRDGRPSVAVTLTTHSVMLMETAAK